MNIIDKAINGQIIKIKNATEPAIFRILFFRMAWGLLLQNNKIIYPDKLI